MTKYGKVWKGFLLLVMVMASTVWAMGGGGSGRQPNFYGNGVSAIGVHFGGKGQAGFNTCKDNEEWVDGKCMEKCAEGVIRGRNNFCDICENDNVYLSYMPEFGTGVCGTSTPLNTATQEDTGCPCANDGKCVSFEYTSNWNYVCAGSDATPCKSNKECANTEYCSLTNSQGESNQPDVGMCMPLTEGVSYTYNNKTFLRSDNFMASWLSAENWCKAKGISLVSLASMDINKDNLGDYFNNHRYCYADGEEKCENVNWDALRTIFGYDNYWWTRDNYAGEAFYVGLEEGSVSYLPRFCDSLFYALCE